MMKNLGMALLVLARPSAAGAILTSGTTTSASGLRCRRA